MAGFAPRLPLMKSTIDGFETLKTINSVVAQNLKMYPFILDFVSENTLS